MKRSLAELQAAHPFDRDEHYWYGPPTIEEAAASAPELHIVEDPIDYLEEIHAADGMQSINIHQVLRLLPPEVVAEELGEEIALWTSVRSVIQGHDTAINEVLREKWGYSIKDLEIAENWRWGQHFDSRPKYVLADYTLIQAMKDGSMLKEVDLQKIIEKSAKEGVTLSSSRLDDYSLVPIEAVYNEYHKGGRVKGWNDDMPEDIRFYSWLDTPTGFALTYKGTPNAMAGVAMGELDEVKLFQVQGVNPKRIDPDKPRFDPDRVIGSLSARGLAPLDWQKVMITVNEELARKMGLSKVGIQAGENNVWTKPSETDGKVHLPVELAKRAYNMPAKRLGYSRSGGNHEDWHKTLE